MVVAHNMLAMNADRQFGINNTKKAKNSEKLSSGYRINRAADDAAGLAISEKMRRQIRGLNQGSENIQDGISLVQVADGAMHEISDMLQRVNELSIKAYNDTNTKQDREYIQAEVGQLIEEIGRVVDSTTFNEIELFKGNPVEYTEAWSNPDGFTTVSASCKAPDWLINGSDTMLEKHQGYSGTQDTSGLMFHTTNYKMVDGVKQADGGLYYGPVGPDIDLGDLGVYKHAGPIDGVWSSELSDNPTAKISFSGLTQSQTADELYQNLFGLLGTAIGVPCGTCNREYFGIGFSGEAKGITFSPTSFSSYSSTAAPIETILNLSEWKGFTNEQGEAVSCLDKVNEIIEKHETDTTLTDAAKALEVEALREEIAEKLCQKVYMELVQTPGYGDHFDRALTDGKYDIIIYDYRDQDKLDAAKAYDKDQGPSDASVNFKGVGYTVVPNSMLPPDMLVENKHPLWIKCSSQKDDKVPIDLPAISIDALGIKDYNVAKYDVQQTVTYSDNYKKKLEEWDKAVRVETITVPEETITYKEKDDIFVFKNGEPTYETVYKDVTVTIPAYTYEELVHNNPKPVPGAGDMTVTYEEAYIPDDVKDIQDALDYIMGCRARLGAQQNRLEHSYNNNQNKHENLTASESLIRDTNMSTEMVDYAKNNILTQVGQSIMAQANQSNQGVLSLLQ